MILLSTDMNQRIQIGARILEERERLRLTQSALGVTPQAQRRYEKGERTPDGEYLSAFAALGADVQYILTGKRQAPPREMDPEIIETLQTRGITIEEDKLFGARVVTFSSTGMAWLLNYLAEHDLGSPALSWSFLAGLLSFEPGGAWRDMRIKAAALPVYDDREYFVYFFYLNGSPPRQLHMFRPDGSKAEGGTIRYGATRDLPFRIAADQDVMIQLSEDEHSDLLKGAVVVVDPVTRPIGKQNVVQGAVVIRDYSNGVQEQVEERRPAAKPGRKGDQPSSGQSSRSVKRDTP